MAETNSQLKLLMLCDFLVPSGYQSIAAAFAKQFSEMGCDVTVLGINYDGREHDYPFRLIPTHLPWLPEQLRVLSKEINPDWILFLMDIQKQTGIIDSVLRHDLVFYKGKKVASIFPVESDPFYRKWAQTLMLSSSLRFTFTDFGVSELKKRLIDAIRLPVGLDEFWLDDVSEPIVRNNDRPFILTVADNQIRKNLSAAIEILAKYREMYSNDLNWDYVLVTNIDSPDGWGDFDDLCSRYGFPADRLDLKHNKSVSQEQLKYLYQNAECFLLPSYAEGIGLPLYEARSQGCPIVATDHPNIYEALNGSGGLVTSDKIFSYPLGGINYYSLNILDAVEKLHQVLVQGRIPKQKIDSWSVAADVILKSMKLYEVVDNNVTKTISEASNEDGLSESETVTDHIS